MINCIFENGNKASLRHVVVHAVVEKDGKILLGKRAEGLLEAGKWGMPAGFLDRDETAQECVLRELKEETGWEGKVKHLFKINTSPNRPKEDRQNITIEFIVEPIRLTGKPDKESTKIEWIPIEKINFEELAFDHGETIKSYLEYRKNPFLLPLFI